MKQKCIALKMQKDSDNANLFRQLCKFMIWKEKVDLYIDAFCNIDPTYQVPVVYFIL
jgi:hypothetical protein